MYLPRVSTLLLAATIPLALGACDYIAADETPEPQGSDGGSTGCGAGSKLCDSECTDVLTDPENCGDCGIICYGTCASGTCYGVPSGGTGGAGGGMGGGTGAATPGASCTDGTQNGDETGVDCGGAICASCPTCYDGVQNGDEVGIDCGGSCAPCPAECSDGRQNGSETDVDCGGDVCGRCMPGQSCDAATDCQSGVCWNGECQAPTCDDGIQNGDESGVDCGGPCAACATCYDGVQNQGEEGVDCGGPCAACGSCTDGVQNQGEAGIDCGGPCADCGSCNDGIQNQGEEAIDCGGPCEACASCSDGIQNQDEADVDCGGPCEACPSCIDGIQNQGEEGVDCGGPCAGCGTTGGQCSLTLDGATGPEPGGAIPVCCAPTDEERVAIMEVFELLNAHRANNGVSPLVYDDQLEAAIQGHCVHMVEHDFFDHAAPESAVGDPWVRAELCGTRANGENIAAGQRSPEDVMEAWTNSSGHNANMLNSRFTRVGIGMHDNHWGQLFGN